MILQTCVWLSIWSYQSNTSQPLIVIISDRHLVPSLIDTVAMVQRLWLPTNHLIRFSTASWTHTHTGAPFIVICHVVCCLIVIDQTRVYLAYSCDVALFAICGCICHIHIFYRCVLGVRVTQTNYLSSEMIYRNSHPTSMRIRWRTSATT